MILQLTKYVQRNGWSGRDLLRLSHPDASALKKRKRENDEDDMRRVFAFAVKPAEEVSHRLHDQEKQTSHLWPSLRSCL